MHGDLSRKPTGQGASPTATMVPTLGEVGENRQNHGTEVWLEHDGGGWFRVYGITAGCPHAPGSR